MMPVDKAGVMNYLAHLLKGIIIKVCMFLTRLTQHALNEEWPRLCLDIASRLAGTSFSIYWVSTVCPTFVFI